MSLGRGIGTTVGLAIVFMGVAGLVSTCRAERTTLKPDYERAAACTEKLKRNVACTLEEQQSKELVQKNKDKANNSAWWIVIGSDVISVFSK